ncbi:unnamed protein product, partial [Amoebophrya sp. A25]|eukprot:GSA25T00009031001.1
MSKAMKTVMKKAPSSGGHSKKASSRGTGVKSTKKPSTVEKRLKVNKVRLKTPCVSEKMNTGGNETRKTLDVIKEKTLGGSKGKGV